MAQQRAIHVDDYDRDANKGRFKVIGAIVVVSFVLLVFRLADLQLFQGARLEKMSRAQKMRTIEINPIRGDVFDRNGKPLAVTKQGFELLLYSDPSLRDFTDLAGSVAELLGAPKDEIVKKFEERSNVPKFQPTIIASDLTQDQVAALEENITDLDCLEVESVPVRAYPQEMSASQLLGYLGEVTGKETGQDAGEIYKSGDIVGRMGVERGWESYLRGVKGEQSVVVDSAGRRNVMFEEKLKLPPLKAPIPGNNVELAIDIELQKACEKALGDNAGAAVVMDVNTGEILASASTPNFNPNHIVGKIDPEEWKALTEDPRRPFFNRPIQGEYPPGSVFKIVVAAAALEKNIINPYETVECKGVVELGSNKDEYHCWYDYGHGNVDLYHSLVQSCDIYYYRLGERLGIDALCDYAHKFGLGIMPRTGLPGEKIGLIPEPLWKRRFIGKSWYLGDTVITAIGQGYTMLSPLQVTRMMTVIANGGKLMRPHIVRRITDADGKTVKEFTPEVEIPRVVSPETCSRIKEALVGVVYDQMGTALGLMGPMPVKVAGKTGTAQVISRSKKKEFMLTQGEIPWKYRDHAWFTAFAPAENPRYAITVMIEHGGAGSEIAAPICGRIIRFLFSTPNKQTGDDDGGP